MVKIIFFDTETTGLATNDKINALDQKGNWPDIVSICWMIFENRTLIRKEYYIIRPEGFIIPYKSTQIHGISQMKAEREGVPLQDVLGLFANDIKDAYLLIAHNIDFDKNVLFNSYKWRLNIDPLLFWPVESEFCSMKESQDELKIIPKRNFHNEMYKRPSLSELFVNQFGYHFLNAHTADGDVDALQKIVFARWNLHDESGNSI